MAWDRDYQPLSHLCVSQDKTMQLLRDATAGAMAVVNYLQMQNHMQTFANCVEQYCRAGMCIERKEPSQEATDYIKQVCDLFVLSGPSAAEGRVLLESLPNGEWCTQGRIPVHRIGIFAEASEEKIKATVVGGLVACIGSRRPHKYCLHR